MTNAPNADFSIVVPVYYNEGCLSPLMQSLSAAVLQANPALSGEIIFIDDGSGDGSFAELRQIQDQFPDKVTIIRLTRNFGQAAALLAGYKHSRGRCVITMSADGQEPPELINDMLKSFFDDEYEIVICARAGRDESLYRVVTSYLFYFLMRRTTFRHMPKGGFDFWLMGRRAVDALIRNSDNHSFFQERVLWMGFRTRFITYHRRKRLAGVSRFTFLKKCAALLDLVLAHSFTPIRIMSLIGCFFSLMGFVYAALILIDSLFYRNPVKGWAPLMLVVLVMGGLQMIMLGLIGEYLWRTLTQVRRHDIYLVDTIYEAAPGVNRSASTSAIQIS